MEDHILIDGVEVCAVNFINSFDWCRMTTITERIRQIANGCEFTLQSNLYNDYVFFLQHDDFTQNQLFEKLVLRIQYFLEQATDDQLSRGFSFSVDHPGSPEPFPQSFRITAREVFGDVYVYQENRI